VYPHHGAVVIQDIVELEMFGTRTTYLKLSLPRKSLTIMVPVASAAEVGIRGVVSRKKAEDVLSLLRGDAGWMPALWNQRFKTNREKLVSGDIDRLAEVIRDLSISDRKRPLAAGEQRLLAKAREILISELIFAVDSSEEIVQTMLDEALMDHASPSPSIPSGKPSARTKAPGDDAGVVVVL